MKLLNQLNVSSLPRTVSPQWQQECMPVFWNVESAVILFAYGIPRVTVSSLGKFLEIAGRAAKKGEMWYHGAWAPELFSFLQSEDQL